MEFKEPGALGFLLHPLLYYLNVLQVFVITSKICKNLASIIYMSLTYINKIRK